MLLTLLRALIEALRLLCGRETLLFPDGRGKDGELARFHHQLCLLIRLFVLLLSDSHHALRLHIQVIHQSVRFTFIFLFTPVSGCLPYGLDEHRRVLRLFAHVLVVPRLFAAEVGSSKWIDGGLGTQWHNLAHRLASVTMEADFLGHRSLSIYF